MTDFEQVIKKITINPGDHLVIKSKYLDEFDRSNKARFQGFLPLNTVLFFADDLDDIRVINQDDMAQLGWLSLSDEETETLQAAISFVLDNAPIGDGEQNRLLTLADKLGMGNG